MSDNPSPISATPRSPVDAILGPPYDEAETAEDESEPPPRAGRPGPASEASDVYAALQKASEALGLLRGRADSG